LDVAALISQLSERDISHHPQQHDPPGDECRGANGKGKNLRGHRLVDWARRVRIDAVRMQIVKLRPSLCLNAGKPAPLRSLVAIVAAVAHLVGHQDPPP